MSYACTKAAIGHMTATLALEYAERGVRVNWVKICFDMKGDLETVRFFLDQVRHAYV